MIDGQVAYRAMTSRDPRFDGVFFVGVTSTGIYCRPVCPVRTPQRKNCRFFESAEAAEKAKFRPCLRCRPELAPGQAPIDHAHRIAHSMMHRIEEGLIDDGQRLEEISAQFDLSSRQLRRIVQKELGVSPIELMQTRRLLLAKQLLTETKRPVTEIAFASGFSSLRRFNDAFRAQYRMPPTRLRSGGTKRTLEEKTASTSTLQLSYRPPYDWKSMLEFLSARSIKGVEFISREAYSRTVRLGKCTGWINVTHAPDKHALMVEFTHSLMPVLPALLGRLRNLFDLAARPDLIAEHLSQDERLKKSVAEHPGLRVPGAFDSFEMAVRAILGQQITVKGATTLAVRFVEKFGEQVATPFSELSRLTPLPGRLARVSVKEIAALGIIGARCRSLIALAENCASRSLLLEAGATPEKTIAQLITLPGIGPWTAQYFAMRALRWPDAFPKEDIAVRNALGGVSAKTAEVLSEAWRPWRSYAVLHLWKMSEKIPQPSP